MDKPEGIEPMDKGLALCEVFKEAQNGKPYYITQENVQCGEQALGMKGYPPVMYSGQLGSMFAMFKTAGANRRIYDYVPKLPKYSVKYIALAAMDQMTFEPDLVILTASPSQAEIILRASSYTNGKMWHAKATTCLACAWIYVHPYLSGKINYTVSGLGFSMKARNVLPDSLLIISFPFDTIPYLIDNLNDME